MQLRHKNTSKWAKQMVRNNPDDVEAKDMLAEQNRQRERLRKKITLESDSDQRDSETEDVATEGTAHHMHLPPHDTPQMGRSAAC